MLPAGFCPTLPFPEFKWKWGTLQCTEGINDPIILLGVLRRMRRIEINNNGARFSSPEFAEELRQLGNDIPQHIHVDLGRGGDRNIIRNSGQYWRALGLIPTTGRGQIELTEFGRLVADNTLSQAEFAAITISTFSLPNRGCMPDSECNMWEQAHLRIYPLRLILEILQRLSERANDVPYITAEELYRIVIPLSGCNHPDLEIDDYVNNVLGYRQNPSAYNTWPNCASRANDRRIAREFLLFLRYYGYLMLDDNTRGNTTERNNLNTNLQAEISNILQQPLQTINEILHITNNINNIASDIERVRVRTSQRRPNQARFRRDILASYRGCIITNVEMPEILEAAHIIPFAYNGEDTIANGFAMRTDIHILFDTGHLRISPDGEIYLSDRARMDYGRMIPPHINIPDFVNREFIRWRWDNPDGL